MLDPEVTHIGLAFLNEKQYDVARMNLTCSVRGRGQALMHSPLSKREKKIFFFFSLSLFPFHGVYLVCLLVMLS